MRRRALFCSPLLLAGASLARAQDRRVAVVGYLDTTGGDAWAASKVEVFRKGLAETAPDLDVRLEILAAEGHYDRLPELAARLVHRQVAAILASALPAALAARAATTTIPIVFVMGADPVAQGLVQALNRPGGNVTGITQFFGTLGGKRLELLAQLVPEGPIAVLSNPANANAELHLNDLRAAARSLKREIAVFQASEPQALDTVYASMAARGMKGLLVADDPMFTQRRELVVSLAARHRLPAIYYTREFVEDGGLASYGTSGPANFRLAGTYVARVLKGEKPATLPVLQPTVFELVINMKAAKALGLAPPPSLLAAADETID